MAPVSPDGRDPIADDELLYRRIPVSTNWYNPATGSVSPEAFRPRPEEDTGISLFRAKYTSLERAAVGRPGKRYFVAVIAAATIRQFGMQIVPAPLPDEPGHAEISGLTYAARKSDAADDWIKQLAKLCCWRVKGPFPSDHGEREGTAP